MRISEMQTLRRTIYTHRHTQFRSFIDHRSKPYLSFSNPPAIAPSSSPNRRTIHHNTRISFRECSNSEQSEVWTACDPTSDKLVTKRISVHGDKSASLSSFVSSDEDSSREGSVRVRNGAIRTSSSSSSSYPSSSSHMGDREERNGYAEKPLVRSGYDSGALKRKKGKSRSVWVCSNCGKSFGQWWGACQACGSSGTVVEFADGGRDEGRTNTGFGASENAVRSWLQQRSRDQRPQRLKEVQQGLNQASWRVPLSGLFGAEVARVLGGGLVPGSLVLIGGDPGVGKSTMLLQIAAMIAEGRDFDRESPVIYVSGEESIEQIGNRADRMRIGTDDLFLYSSTDIEDILEKTQPLLPRALIIDSIQTVYLKGVAGSAGGVIQVKECTSALLRFAKDTNIPVLLVGHVTKTGDIAGPRVLEHIVDVVLYMEGEKYSNHRFLRSVKNRFGSTDELGVFEMSPSGLQAVVNPSEMFLGEQCVDSEVLAGLAVAVIIDGSRTFLIEIQALCLHDSSIERQFTGVDKSRAGLIIAVLIKQAGLKLQDHAIFVNVVSGLKLEDTAGDLAIAASICSSFLEFPVPNDVAFIGEIGLGGELRPVPRMDKRVIAVAKLGYKKCIVPKSAEKSLSTLQLEMEILACKNLREVINYVFR